MNRTPWPFPTTTSHPAAPPQPASDLPQSPAPTLQVQHVSESTLDHAVEESFPASDPVSVVSTKVVEPRPADAER